MQATLHHCQCLPSPAHLATDLGEIWISVSAFKIGNLRLMSRPIFAARAFNFGLRAYQNGLNQSGCCGFNGAPHGPTSVIGHTTAVVIAGQIRLQRSMNL